MSFIRELKRRNVFRVAVAYVVGAWVIIEVSSLILGIYDAPDSIPRIIVALLALGMPFVLFFAWAFEVTPDGIKRETDVHRSVSGELSSGNRLTFLTIGLAAIALVFFYAGRFFSGQPGDSTAAVENHSSTDKALWATQQLVELNRLRSIGDTRAAFALASEIEPFLADTVSSEDLWADISRSADIESDPSGAQVQIQSIVGEMSDPEILGTTPLNNVRFAVDDGYRVRFDLEGYRSVELLNEALVGGGARETILPPIRTVKLDRKDELPEEMVRIPGLTEDQLAFADFFMDRFEVTNRDYQKFVAAGGYETLEYWTHDFVVDGNEILWQEAITKFVDKTGRPGPASWTGGAYSTGQGDYPVNGVSWYEAAAYANFVKKSLPTWTHHLAARRYYFLNSWLIASRSNLGGDRPRPVGENQAMTSIGVYDLIGNVREWSLNSTGNGTKGTTGAAWTDAPYVADHMVAKASWDRDLTNGIRLVRTFDSPEIRAKLLEPVQPLPIRDFSKEKPVSDTEFSIYRRLYAYDPFPLNAEVVQSDSFEHWTRERVAFDLPYGERGGAYLYIPKHVEAPFETVLFWPGDGALIFQSIDQAHLAAFDFIVRNGRAVVQPILKGTYDRDDAEFSIVDHDVIWGSDGSTAGTRYRDFQIKWVQELSRTIDYLETREDIKTDTLGYNGFSWGAFSAPIVLAVEDRIHVAVLNAGGLDDTYRYLPEGDAFNFVTRVKVPVLMINGEYDGLYPLETSQKPMFELLGTEPKHKKLYVTPAAHFAPRDALIRETLDWLDRYFED